MRLAELTGDTLSAEAMLRSADKLLLELDETDLMPLRAAVADGSDRSASASDSACSSSTITASRAGYPTPTSYAAAHGRVRDRLPISSPRRLPTPNLMKTSVSNRVLVLMTRCI